MPKRKNKNKKPLIFFFVLFVVIALLMVVLLEYLDFKKGKKSFIFTKIVALKTVSERIEYFNSEFQGVLKKQNLDYDHVKDEKNVYHFKLSISDSRFDDLYSKIINIVKKAKGNLKLSELQKFTTKTVRLYRIKFGDKVSHLLLITQIRKVKVKKKEIEEKQTPKIAFIIDDVGNRNSVSVELKKLNIPITASILPDTPFAEEEGWRLKSYGLEMMIHLPMQPKNSNARYPRNKYITMDSTDYEIKKLIRGQKLKFLMPGESTIIWAPLSLQGEKLSPVY